MRVDLASLHKILRDSTRRDILLHLSRNGSLTYMELMDFLKITNTGKFNYHLKVLGGLIEKGEDGRYRLTEKGNTAIELFEKFSEKNSGTTQSASEKVATVPESPRTRVRSGIKRRLRYISIALILIMVIAVPLSLYAVANNVVAHALDVT
jgi:DNA-binding HxlR family transcriptional regulator